MIDKNKILTNAIDTYINKYDKYIGFEEHLEYPNDLRIYKNSDGVETKRSWSDPDTIIKFNDIEIAKYLSDPSLEDLYLIKEIKKEGYFDDMKKVLSKESIKDSDIFTDQLKNTIESFGVSLNDIKEFDVIEDNFGSTVFRLDGIFDKTLYTGIEFYNNNDDPREIKIIAKYHNKFEAPYISYLETYYDITFKDVIYKEYNLFIYEEKKLFGIIYETVKDDYSKYNITNNRAIIHNIKMEAQVVELTKMDDFFIVNKIGEDSKGFSIYESGSSNPLLRNFEPTFYNIFGVPNYL